MKTIQAQINKRKDDWVEKHSNPAEFEESGQQEAMAHGCSIMLVSILESLRSGGTGPISTLWMKDAADWIEAEMEK